MRAGVLGRGEPSNGPSSAATNVGHVDLGSRDELGKGAAAVAELRLVGQNTIQSAALPLELGQLVRSQSAARLIGTFSNQRNQQPELPIRCGANTA